MKIAMLRQQHGWDMYFRFGMLPTMLRIHILDYLEKLNLLAEFDCEFSAVAAKQKPPPTPFQATQFVQFLSDLREYCLQIDLVFSVQQIDRLMEACLQQISMQQLSSLVQELRRRIEDELRDRAFAFIPPQRMEFYTREMHWPEALSSFPSIGIDLEECGRCFLFGRFTASVFHAQRVLETGLRTLAKALNVSTDANRSWDSLLKKIDDEIKKPRQQQDPDFRSRASFYSEAAAMFRAIKTSWRNPTMHVEKTYNEKKTREILTASTTFMRHLATELRE